MNENEFLELNKKRKKLEGILTIVMAIIILSGIITYLIFIRNSSFFQDSFIEIILRNIKTNIASFSILGSFYIALFGALFFVLLPMEAYFLKAITLQNPTIVYFIFLIAITISFSINYLLGMKFSKISKKLIPSKKFYQLKSYINRYSKLAIFFVNVIPMFPSPQVTFILGVFRYNKTRLFIITMISQTIKFITIILILKLF